MRIGACFPALIAIAAQIASAQNNAAGHWVATWTTAVDLAAGGRPTGPAANLPATLADQSVRMIARVSIGGPRVRLELSNMINAKPLEIGAAHVALHKSGGTIFEGSDRPVTFGGRESFTIPAGAMVVSDPVDLDVAPLSQVAVTLYFPRDTGAPTNHMLGLHTGYISKGDSAAAVSMPDAATMFAYAWLTGIEVQAPAAAYAVVAFGDSI